MKENSAVKVQNSMQKGAAVLWDESFLWGIMARKALIANGLAFDLIRSEDVRTGKLREYRLLFVPGGWASNKVKALGDEGVREIVDFVREGGSYVGFCGGAGLATADGIGLLPVKRRPTRDRVPSFSGPIMLNVGEHPIWEGIVNKPSIFRDRPDRLCSQPVFHAWWPSQFLIDGSVSVLATYGPALPEAFSSDLNVGDVDANGEWAGLERVYQINLDPKRLMYEPAVIEGAFGKGKVLLSLVHFDTPVDKNGAITLKNLWKYLGVECEGYDAKCTIPGEERPGSDIVNRGSTSQTVEAVSQIEYAAAALIELGLRNFLWFWRNPLLLQWRRGVRGLECCTLYIMARELSEILEKQDPGREALDARRSLRLVTEFVDKAKQLLVRERHAMQNSPITYERCDDREIQSLRAELFSRAKSHGGLFKQTINELDRLLLGAMLRR